MESQNRTAMKARTLSRNISTKFATAQNEQETVIEMPEQEWEDFVGVLRAVSGDIKREPGKQVSVKLLEGMEMILEALNMADNSDNNSDNQL